jgi:hypothetical protein
LPINKGREKSLLIRKEIAVLQMTTIKTNDYDTVKEIMQSWRCYRITSEGNGEIHSFIGWSDEDINNYLMNAIQKGDYFYDYKEYFVNQTLKEIYAK